MRARLIGALILGLGGVAILLALANWQFRRLEWKSGVLDQIETRIAAEPVALPDRPDPETDRYLAVSLTGEFTGTPVRVQSALEGQGAGYRIEQAFQAGARRLIVERGFVPQAAKIPPAPEGEVTISGNLVWPDEVDGFTPAPDFATGLFYARELSELAAELGTEPLLVVRRDGPAGGRALLPAPVSTAGIPNDHLEYALTWLSLAAVWLVMSAYLIYRILKQAKGETT
ncbi:surfeit locus 1 family protein [Pseudooceanicola antarcticus]|uniref:SURF1-like protein n=1 Tax=Pseudooceanicola antarcticus TaxID=1247613 RepID=A0A285ITT2_9RHOB|nr:SURF1 family protein [Pseudooceanicola antarcticus]PJE31977.1 SURF1 family protein [Pseudooceanicola antarcticus]SNY51097.1 surfeit locus 1 family protein [Pseudooceanicola antarcticus]